MANAPRCLHQLEGQAQIGRKRRIDHSGTRHRERRCEAVEVGHDKDGLPRSV